MRLPEPKIIWESPEWLIVDKPAGWLTIAGRGLEAPVLLDWARSQRGEAMTVHRIDRETSGVLLFARNPAAHRKANQWFEAHQVKKTYACLASGVPAAPMLKIQQPIEGARALTQVEVQESYQEGFLARVRIVTGKRHQIRIHLSGQGHPLWGDTRYGGPASVALSGGEMPVERVALHAERLELPTGEKFQAEWPEDFMRWRERLREEGHRV